MQYRAQQADDFAAALTAAQEQLAAQERRLDTQKQAYEAQIAALLQEKATGLWVPPSPSPEGERGKKNVESAAIIEEEREELSEIRAVHVQVAHSVHLARGKRKHNPHNPHSQHNQHNQQQQQSPLPPPLDRFLCIFSLCSLLSQHM